jgi:hypothetical protein
MSFAEEFLRSATAKFAAQKDLAERAFRQLPPDKLHVALSAETNSIAVIMKHMAGNMRSRWTDLLTSDGEKEWRDRDSEFIDDFRSHEALLGCWRAGWDCLFAALAKLSADDLLRSVTIRGKPHTVVDAIHRQLDHYGYHVGQIVLIARVLAGDNWTVLTVPRGGTQEYNARVWEGQKN